MKRRVQCEDSFLRDKNTESIHWRFVGPHGHPWYKEDPPG